MNRRSVQACFFIVIFFLVLIYAHSAFSKEDTAYISFKRVGVSRSQTDTYTVKENEWLLGIIRKNYDVSAKEAYRILRLVRRANPELRNMDVIYPGQKLLLPRKKSSETDDAAHTDAGMTSDKRQAEVVLKYVVKRGDSISGIIHGKFGKSRANIYKMMAIVGRLNPNIKDLNRIYPGQSLLLPGNMDETKPVQSEGEKLAVPEHELMPVVTHVINRMYGTVITNGNYCIPLPPSGEVKIDCSMVPVIEMDGCNTILLDLSNGVPADLKKIVESTWEKYRIISVGPGEGISSILERVIGATGRYEIKKVNRYEKIGNMPAIRVCVGWLVSRKPGFAGTGSYAFNFVRSASRLVPLPVKAWAQAEGLEIIEIMDGVGIAVDKTEYQPCSVQVLDSGSNMELANSLLGLLGYEPEKNSGVDVVIGDGLTMSMKVDLLLNLEVGRILINSSSIPDQVIDILQEKGDRIAFISSQESRSQVIEKIMRVMNISFSNQAFAFPLSQRNEKECGDISLPAVRLGDDKMIYLVDYDVDGDICGLLNKEYNVTLVRY